MRKNLVLRFLLLSFWVTLGSSACVFDPWEWPAVCLYGGQSFLAGKSFPSTDGCNTCTCDDKGQVSCTLRACSPEQCGGIAGLACKKASDFCKMAAGTCKIADNMGICTTISQNCDTLYAPVCGCDNKTYGNECLADVVGVAIDYKGECKNVGPACKYNGQEYKEGDAFPSTDGCNTCSCTNGQVVCTLRACQTCGGRGNQPCPVGQFCSFGPDCGTFDKPGVCVEKPQACTQQHDPVCGCDGQTYGNACSAASSGVSIKSQGACPITTCTYEGKVYKVGETFPAADGCNKCTCGQDGQVGCTKIACPEQCGGFVGLVCKNTSDFCKMAAGTCKVSDNMGACTPPPGGCPENYDPVCGCDGKTYSNECDADAAKVSIDYKGACKAPPNCTYNGAVYKDGETFPAGDTCNTCTCTNGQANCSKRACPTPEQCGGIAGIACKNTSDFCKYAEGTCGVADQMGTCTAKPQNCTALAASVCGCNGQTYGNECEADAAGISVSYKGACK